MPVTAVNRRCFGGIRSVPALGGAPQADGLPGSFFAGLIDEVRISRGARYEGESLQPPQRHRSDADTTLLLDFDSGSVQVAPDSGPDGRHFLVLPVQTLVESGR